MNEFKIGDKVRLRDDLEEGEVYGGFKRKRIDNILYI